MEKNKILMIVIIALLVMLLGAIVFLGFSFSKYVKKSASQEVTVTQDAVKLLSIDEVQLIDMAKPINTNLKDSNDGSSHIASVNISIGVNNTDKKKSPLIVQTITEKESIVRDICLNIFRSKTYEELKTSDGPDNLRQEILSSLQDEFQSNLIYQIYFDNWYTE